MTKTLTYTIHLTPLEGGGYLVTVPALAGCATQGDTYEHAVEMAKEAIQAYVAVLIEDGDPIPKEPDPARAIVVGVDIDIPVMQ